MISADDEIRGENQRIRDDLCEAAVKLNNAMHRAREAGITVKVGLYGGGHEAMNVDLSGWGMFPCLHLSGSTTEPAWW